MDRVQHKISSEIYSMIVDGLFFIIYFYITLYSVHAVWRYIFLFYYIFVIMMSLRVVSNKYYQFNQKNTTNYQHRIMMIKFLLKSRLLNNKKYQIFSHNTCKNTIGKCFTWFIHPIAFEINDFDSWERFRLEPRLCVTTKHNINYGTL